MNDIPIPEAAPIFRVCPRVNATLPPLESKNPIPPPIIPAIALEKAPSLKPSQNDPPVIALIVPPRSPPNTALFKTLTAIAKINFFHAKPKTHVLIPGINKQAIAAMTIIAVTISFQCSLHH